jgi:hypothetical protein
MQVTKPSHKKYLLSSLDNATYCKYATVYGHAKCYGVRGIYGFLTGIGLYGVVKDLAKGHVVQYGKRKLSAIIISGCAYISAPAVAVLTNATRVVRTCQIVFVSIGYVAEAIEDASQVPFLPVDMIIFGQSISTMKPGRFSNNSWSNITDLIKELPNLDD